MASQVQVVFFLVVIGLVNANTSSLAYNDTTEFRLPRGLHARFDKLFDLLRPRLAKILGDNGMDPLELASFSENILPLPGSLGGTIAFFNGYAHNLAEVRRTNHVSAYYHDKMLVLDMELGWKTVDFNYEYLYHHLLVRRTGRVFGSFHDLYLTAVATIDLENYKVSLSQLKFIRVGKFQFKLAGHKLDRILNVLSKVVTTVFKDRVLSIVEDRSLLIFDAVIDRINNKFPRPKRLETLRSFATHQI